MAAKAANQRTVIRRLLRDHGGTMPPVGREAPTAERRLTDVARRTLASADVDLLRGLEGERRRSISAPQPPAAGEDPAFVFGGRSRRPPLDPINTLLSFLYALLGHDCRSVLEAHGLHPQVGFLHADRPGRASLAWDLMEELHPVLADRLCRASSTAGSPRETSRSRMRAARLTDEARRRVLEAWQERKRDEPTPPFVGGAMPLGLVAHAQAQRLAHHLRGALTAIPASSGNDRR